MIDTYRYIFSNDERDFRINRDILWLPRTELVTSVFSVTSDKTLYSEFACLLDDEYPESEGSCDLNKTELFRKTVSKSKKQKNFLHKKYIDENLDDIIAYFKAMDQMNILASNRKPKRGLVDITHKFDDYGDYHSDTSDICTCDIDWCKIHDEEFEVQGLIDDKISSFMTELSKIFSSHSINSKIAGLFENISILVYSLWRSQSREEMCLAVINFYKCVTKSNFVESKLVSKSVHYIKKLFSDDLVQQSFDTDAIRDILTDYKKLKKSTLYKKIEKIYMFCLSHALLECFNVSFTQCGYSELEADAIKRKHNNYPDMLYDVLDTALYVIEIIKQYFNKGNFKSIIFGFTDAEGWIDRCYDLDLKSKYLHNPEAAGFNIFAYLADLKMAIEQGETLLKYDGGIEKNLIKKALHNLKKIDMDYRSIKQIQKGRKAPLVMLVEGPSSIGKSSFKDIVRYHYAKLFDLPTGPEYTYTRIFQDEYWSGFSSHMWCLVLDDIAFMLGEKQPNGDESLREIIQINNNVSFCPPQAALEDKGKTPLLCEFVVGSTNTLDLGAHEHFRCPIATLRRFNIPVRLKLKPEYKTPEGFLDVTKLPESDPTRYDDFWIIQVCKVVPESNDNRCPRGKFLEDPNLRFNNIDDFLRYFSERAHKHKQEQERFLLGEKCKEEVRVCKTCYYVMSKCTCSMTNQTDDHDMEDSQITLWENGGLYYLSDSIQWLVNIICSWFTFGSAMFTLIDYSSSWIRYLLAYLSIDWLYGIYFPLFIYCISYICTGAWIGAVKKKGMYMFTKIVIRRCSKKALQTYNENKTLTHLALALSLLLLAYKTFVPVKEVKRNKNFKLSKLEKHDSLSCDIEGCELCEIIPVEKQDYSMEISDIDDGVRMQPKAEDTNNVWIKENYILSPCDVTEAIISKCSPNDFYNRVGRNTFIIRTNFYNDDGRPRERVNRMLGLRGQLYVTNYHGIHVREDGSLYFEVAESSVQGINPKNMVIVPRDKWYRPANSDLVYMCIRGRPAVADISKLFPLHTLNTIMNGKYIVRERDGTISLIDVYRIEPKMHYNSEMGFECEVWMGRVNEDTKKGECGSPLIADYEGGRFLLGIHLLGGPGKVGAIKICLEDIIIAEQKICEYMTEAGYIHISAPGFARHLGDLSKKSIFRYIEDGNARVFGTFQEFKTPAKTMVKDSLISDDLVKQGLEKKWTKPVMKGWEPWRKAVKPIVKPKFEYDPSILQESSDDYYQQIIDNVSKKDLEELRELDWFNAVNGVDGVRYLDKINFNTSSGAPYKKCKRFFTTPCDDDDTKMEFDEVIMGECKIIVSKYKNGEQYHPVFTGALKDEAITWAKFYDKKTRMFAGSPLPWSLVVRKYLLTFIRMFQKNSFIFEGMVGVNCHSKDWEEIRKYLTEFTLERMIAGDFKAFDKGMFAEFILEAFRIIRKLHEGYVDPQHLQAIYMIGQDIAFPVVDVNGDLVQFFGFNPSGQPLTVIINCIVHSLYMRYVFFSILRQLKQDKENPDLTLIKDYFKNGTLKFNEHVKLATYGDDGAAGVRETVPWFTHTTIQSELRKIGIEYTMADKESESIPYINIDDVSFLKRVWKYDERFGCHVAPLEMDSIHKSLMVTVVSRSVPQQEQMMSTIRSALMECFYHGKEVFDKYSAMLKKICEREDLKPFVNEHTFPLYDELIYNFENAKQMLKYVASV